MMSSKEEKKKLTGPWRSIHGAIWLIGLGILAWTDWWWPGIMFLIGISVLFEAILMRSVPEAFEKDEPEQAAPTPLSTPAPSPASPPPLTQVKQDSEHRVDLLPASCPRCGGPVRGSEVKWTGTRSAECSYCGAKLPMSSG